MIILGIETSCDETAAAVVEFDPKTGSFFIHSNVVSSQVKIHAKYGGIVPEVAARNHVVNIIPVIHNALEKLRASANKTKKQKSKKTNDANDMNGSIDAIAVTNGPGLITSLLVGVETAKTLAWAWGKPLIAVNHLEGHVFSAISNYKFQISNKISNSKAQISKLHTSCFPIIALVVSGGHTQLVLMKDFGKYEVVGETRDDAAGEAFDKVAKLLGLGYPGGPIIAKEAEKFLISNCLISNKISNSKTQITLPRPMIDSRDFDFSFSGLKTAVLYLIKELQKKNTSNISTRGGSALGEQHLISNICAEFQQAGIDVLVTKTQRAANKYGAKKIILAGGVSANKELRRQFEKIFGDKLLLPAHGLSTDNAAMIAMAGTFHYLKKGFVEIDKIRVDPNLSL